MQNSFAKFERTVGNPVTPELLELRGVIECGARSAFLVKLHFCMYLCIYVARSADFGPEARPWSGFFNQS